LFWKLQARKSPYQREIFKPPSRTPSTRFVTADTQAMKYFINRSLLPPLEVEIEGVPPCLFCDAPVYHPSTGGPLVCNACDCGWNRDGSSWTAAQSRDRHEHWRAKIAEYSTCAKAKEIA
jgi:hypothetical protein